MIFISKTNNKSINTAIEIANEIKEDLVDALKEVDVFTFACSNLTNIELAKLIEENHLEMNVHSYWSRNRKVLGYFDSRFPFNIYVNRSPFPRTKQSLVATFVHEYIHALDHTEKDYFFHHGNNKYVAWKERTAAYFCDNLAEEIVKKKLGVFNTDSDIPRSRDENKNIVTYTPWWARASRRIGSFFRRFL